MRSALAPDGKLGADVRTGDVARVGRAARSGTLRDAMVGWASGAVRHGRLTIGDVGTGEARQPERAGDSRDVRAVHGDVERAEAQGNAVH